MGRAILWSLLLCSVLEFFPCHSAVAAGVGRGFVTVSTSSFAVSSTCIDDSASPGRAAPPRQNGTSAAVLRLTHRHGPCGPAAKASALGTTPPSLLDTLRADQRRAEYVLRRVSGAAAGLEIAGSKSATVPANLGFSIGTLQYVVTVSLGTPAVAQTVEVDTGSDVSWVQCKPCPSPPCYNQKDPLFDPTRSSSYSAVPCGSPACSSLKLYASGCSSGGQCGYVVSYGDGSTTTGVYSSDALTLTGSDSLKGFLFGCGHSQQGLFAGIDGLLGLGRQSQSLVSQASNTYGGAFSYCLPPTQNSVGYLTLGASATTTGFSTTPLLTASNDPTYYMVMLAGISVGGQQLGIDASVFASGAVVDTGTVVTRLPPTAYAALRSAFRAAMAPYGYPTAPATGILDTCYDFSRYGSVTLPTISISFGGGAAMDLGPTGILTGGCLAFAPTGGDTQASILGNVQQRSFEVRFDGSTVGFMPGSC
uniref:Peptidase A1 domain-containing protein n=1 Tax=Leersia perrieri TaxID=77586 RepID=A0A0D9VKC0_9ORYZ